MTQDSLSDAAQVAAWLKDHGSSADRTRAQQFYNAGKTAAAEGRWGIATKAFGDSALHYPAPDTLAQYADARLRELGAVRMRTGTIEKLGPTDLARAERIYRAALAADAQVGQLSPEARGQIDSDARCLAAYLESRHADSQCRPLGLYGLK